MKSDFKEIFITMILCLLFSMCIVGSAKAEETTFGGLYDQTSDDLTWSLTPEGHLTITGTGDYGVSYHYPAWRDYTAYIKTATVKNVSGITLTQHMFGNCENLTSVEFIGFDTSQVTSMAYMFYGCSSLTELDLSGLDTRNVTDMSSMFGSCSSLTSLVIKGNKFSTSKVTGMASMFSSCSSLENLDVSGLDVSSVTTMFGMFRGCSSLKTLDLSTFNAVKAEKMQYMFSECSSLGTITLSGFKASSVKSVNNMFYNCTALKEVVFDENFDTSNVTEMYALFENCVALEKVDLSHFNTANVTTMIHMFYNASSLKTLNLSNFNTENVTCTGAMFYNCQALTALDLSNFYTPNLGGCWDMFEDCRNLQIIDISSLDTRNVKQFSSMFLRCYKLQKIKVNKETFNTDSATELTDMFQGCYKLESFDFSNFNTTNVEDMSRMFNGCDSLKEIDLSSFSLPNISTDTVINIFADNLEKFTSGKEKRLYNLGATSKGWHDGKGNRYANNVTIELEPNTTLYCLENYYNIEYVYDGELIGEKKVYYLDNTLSLTTSVAKEHYTFGGWYSDAKCTQKVTEITAGTFGDITLYAKMIPNDYSISYKYIDDITNEDKLTKSYTYGNETAIVAPLKVCYLLDGWYTDETLTTKFNKITKTTSGDLVLYATWKPNHDLDKENGVILREATTIEEGQIRYQCKNCDYTETETVPRLVTDESQIDDDDIINNPNDGDIEGSDFSKFQVWANKTTQKSIRIKWNKIEGADGYKVYGNNCGKKNRCELLKDIKNVKKTSWTYKKLKKGKYYKFIVRAYKVVDGQEITLAVSKTIHVATNGGKKGNAKAVDIKTDRKMKKTSSGYTLTLKKNKSYTIKAKEVAKDKKISRHRNIRFVSTDKEVATVTSKGVVKTKKAGSCFIYVYAQNGVYKKVKVVVK